MTSPTLEESLTPDVRTQRTAVYRFFDDQGHLLYVGITADLIARWRAHEKNAEWWSDQARIEVIWYESREAADMMETEAVRNEGSVHNISKRGKTPLKTIRIEPSLWDRLGEATERLGTDRSTWLRDAARWCVGEPDAPQPQRPPLAVPPKSVDIARQQDESHG